MMQRCIMIQYQSNEIYLVRTKKTNNMMCYNGIDRSKNGCGAMKKIRTITIALMCIATLSFSGCADMMFDYDVSNEWIEMLEENDIDYKTFSEPIQGYLCEMRDSNTIDSESFGIVISIMESALEQENASQMETEAIIGALMEDTLAFYGIGSEYATAETIHFAIQEYCNFCYEEKKTVKAGEYILKVSSKAPKGKVKYNGKKSDLQLYVNKYIHSEARNGYYKVVINEYNTPIAVYWSRSKSVLKKSDDYNEKYTWDVEEIQNGVTTLGRYPGKFSFNNLQIWRTVKQTSLWSQNDYIDDIYNDSLNSDEVVESMVESFKYDYSNSLAVGELGVEAANEKLFNDIFDKHDDVSISLYSDDEIEEVMSIANTNAKLVFTNAATWCTKCMINDVDIRDGWYHSDLTQTSDSCEYNGSDLATALKMLMGGTEGAGNALVFIKNGSPDEAFWSRESDLMRFDTNNIPNPIKCDGTSVIGSYTPNCSEYKSIIAESKNYVLN